MRSVCSKRTGTQGASPADQTRAPNAMYLAPRTILLLSLLLACKMPDAEAATHHSECTADVAYMCPDSSSGSGAGSCIPDCGAAGVCTGYAFATGIPSGPYGSMFPYDNSVTDDSQYTCGQACITVHMSGDDARRGWGGVSLSITSARRSYDLDSDRNVMVEGDPTVFGTVTLESGLSGSDKICFPPRTTEYDVLIIANEDAEYETEYYMRRYGFYLPGIAWRLEDEDGQHIYSFGPRAPAGAGGLHTTNRLSWKDYANDKSSIELWRLPNFMWFGIECETPTDTSGYDITEQYVEVTSSSSNDQFYIFQTCATGYYGNPSATRCTGPYSPAPCRYINEENVYITSENRYLPTSAATTGCFSAGPYTLSGCTACADIMNDIAGVLDGSCTQCGGSNPGNCTSASCDTGYHSFVDGVGCSECTPVAHAEADAIYSCTTATDSRATGGCAAGFWKDNSGSADVCIECTPVAHAGTGAIYSCSTAADSVVVACRGEYFLNEGSCDAWSPECETHQIMTRGASNSQDRICQEKCADERSPHMIANDKYCESWPSLGQMCTKSRWRSLKYCQQSCSTLGFGYEDDECPLQYVCSNKRSPHMLEKGKFCESWSHLHIMCARPRWNEKKFCEQSCFDSGLGYAGGGC